MPAPLTRRTRKHGTGWIALVASLAAVVASFTAVSAATAAPTGYLALGDSYAAGQGVGGVKGSRPECLQSPASYPSQVAANLGVQLTDNTCADAVLSDVFSPSATGAPPQASASAADIGTITLTMSGNDLGFVPILQSCLAGSPVGPVLSDEESCQKEHTVNGVDQVAAKVVSDVIPRLTSTLTQLRATYPQARILVVGYLPLMPDAAHTPAGGCFSPLNLEGPSFPFVTTDLEWINSVQRLLDAQSELAAEASGVEYLSLMTAAADHSACSTSGTPYIDPLTLNGFTPAPSSMHPNAAGLRLEGQAITSALSTQPAFHGVRGQLIPQGGNQYDLQVFVPTSTLHTTPEVTARKNGTYLGHVSGEFGWYLSLRSSADYRTYSQRVTVLPGEVVELTTDDGTRQVLTPLPDSFKGVTGQVVQGPGDSYELQIWVPTNSLASTPDISARINGNYAAHVSGDFGYYLSVRNVPGYRVYFQPTTLKAGDSVVLNVTSTGEQQKLR
ncbi:SGNH/GDSL hydrolase family protein [Leifsonia sp. 2MCAF36]|uniref:SGNH/GDSL hydrolase family protein n=1 Tax=Leifsonia sp. 2MCAF36 TaxID=3232988 RepID=UPI003F9C93E7